MAGRSRLASPRRTLNPATPAPVNIAGSMPDEDDGFGGTNVPGRISKTVTGRTNIWARPESQHLVGSDLMVRQKLLRDRCERGAETKTQRGKASVARPGPS